MGKMLEDITKSGKTRLGTLEERAEHAVQVAKRALGPLHGEHEDAPETLRKRVASVKVPQAPSIGAAEAASGDTLQHLAKAVSTLSTVAKAIGVAAMLVRTTSGVVRMLQPLAPGRPSWPGHRGSTLGTVAILGAGAVVGAGVAVALIASTEGDQTLAQHLEIAK